MILSVDDSEDDNFLLRRAFRKNGSSVDLRIVNDGQEAIEYLTNASDAGENAGNRVPDLILLDLKMPRKDGFAVLDWLQEEGTRQHLPVAVFTSSQSKNDIDRAYCKGADFYLVKPVALEGLMDLARGVERWTETGEASDLTKSPYYRAPSGGI